MDNPNVVAQAPCSAPKLLLSSPVVGWRSVPASAIVVAVGVAEHHQAVDVLVLPGMSVQRGRCCGGSSVAPVDGGSLRRQRCFRAARMVLHPLQISAGGGATVRHFGGRGAASKRGAAGMAELRCSVHGDASVSSPAQGGAAVQRVVLRRVDLTGDGSCSAADLTGAAELQYNASC